MSYLDSGYTLGSDLAIEWDRLTDAIGLTHNAAATAEIAADPALSAIAASSDTAAAANVAADVNSAENLTPLVAVPLVAHHAVTMVEVAFGLAALVALAYVWRSFK